MYIYACFGSTHTSSLLYPYRPLLLLKQAIKLPIHSFYSHYTPIYPHNYVQIDSCHKPNIQLQSQRIIQPLTILFLVINSFNTIDYQLKRLQCQQLPPITITTQYSPTKFHLPSPTISPNTLYPSYSILYNQLQSTIQPVDLIYKP